MAKGKPLVALRLSPEMIAGLKICARKHGVTVSDLLRELIEKRLNTEGIRVADKPLEGQLSI